MYGPVSIDGVRELGNMRRDEVIECQHATIAQHKHGSYLEALRHRGNAVNSL